MTDPTDLRQQLRRVIATAGGWDVDALEPHDFQAETTAVLAVVQAELDRSRATIRRLNYRCQQAESKLATLKRIVSEWLLVEKGTYVPLRSITAIAKLAGRDIEDDRYVLHYQRIQGLEDAAARAARILLRATADRASSRTALLELDPKEA